MDMDRNEESMYLTLTRLEKASKIRKENDHGIYIPLDENLNEISHNRWKKEDKQRYHLKSKARLTYEGCTKVKRNELSLIVHQYEFFNMEENKLKTYKICLTILNKLIFLGKTIIWIKSKEVICLNSEDHLLQP
ncbi:hypothetical protein HKD37_16G046066 [Glycine soja]